ncbi:MAG TPA: CHASE3 domain-containing protein, partial [Polyangiaceae bacterium]|nr:CHASE3 domain-containing protein [Polyangiaceae bacterium]
MPVGPLERRITPWLLALVALILVGGVAYTNARGYVATQAAVREALSAREAANGVLSQLKDLETGTRGFMLTGEERFLDPYISARARLPQSLHALAELGKADGELGSSARRIGELANQKLDYAERLVRFGRNDKVQLKETLALLEAGKTVMDALRTEVERMIERTDRRLEQRERETANASFRLQLALAGMLCGAVVIALGGLSGARRQIEA